MTNQKKTDLRTQFRARRAALSNDLRTGRNQMLWGNIFAKLPGLCEAKTLLFYFPLPQEISLIPIFNRARELGLPCAFPRCGEQKGEMEFYFVDSLDELALGKYGICEPLPTAQKVTDLSEAVVFVPAFAFDREGYRLGYGGGYYDRFLAAHPLLSVGITYEEFLVDALPRCPYDQAVNILVTEAQVYFLN